MKSTKIIAGLGVAAALGVAALPVATFAADYSANVPVSATISDSIRIEIKDGNASGEDKYVGYTPAQKADDTEAGTTAFGTLKTVDFSSLSLGGGAESGAKTFIKVTTNYPNGFTLTGTAGDLTGTTSGATIAAGATSVASTTGNTTSAWGFNIQKSTDNGDAAYIGSTGEHTYVKTATDTVNTLNTKHVYEYSIGYGITVSQNQAADTYNGSATFKVSSDAVNLDTTANS